ncbi:hypothetical protein LX15_000358, partial [Streptoalloteichus tenebrarius]|nr:hypothetical protein [Streptoalloteichus tenebrarius]
MVNFLTRGFDLPGDAAYILRGQRGTDPESGAGVLEPRTKLPP